MTRSPPQRSPISRLLHAVGAATSTAAAATTVAMVVMAFLVSLVVLGSPSSWEEGFSTVAAAVTLVMVFIIQHTQSRQQTATQVKLDELIRASPRADDHLVHIEIGGDDELVAHEQRQREHHAALRDDAGPPGHDGVSSSLVTDR
jgi:low affinity Fe/Cu permease